MTSQQIIQDTSTNSFYTTKDGMVPFWDHPLISGYKVLPNDYKPHTSIEAALSLYQRQIIKDEDLVILKVLGDAICANEDQLRRYMSTLMSRSHVSKRLERMRRYGLVERWKMRIKSDEEEELKPPAPFTLGIAGFKLMKHYYNDHFFMDHNRWDYLGPGGIQRYVAMNELRCRLVERRSITKWVWTPMISHNRLLPKPLAATTLKTPKGNVNLLIDRLQMNQDFIGFMREKLHKLKGHYKEKGHFKLESLDENQSVYIIFASTLSMAERLHKEVMFDTFPFTIWVCVEEDMVKEGIGTAFYKAEGDKLQRLRLGFLEASTNEGA